MTNTTLTDAFLAVKDRSDDSYIALVNGQNNGAAPEELERLAKVALADVVEAKVAATEIRLAPETIAHWGQAVDALTQIVTVYRKQR